MYHDTEIHRFVTQVKSFNVIIDEVEINDFLKQLASDFKTIISLGNGNVLVVYRVEVIERDG